MILLDTHALVWLTIEPTKLSAAAAAAIRGSEQTGGLAISAASLWEIAFLATRRRIDFIGPVEDFVTKLSSRTSIRPITPKIAILACQLPPTYSKDPIDRLIGGTALAEGMDLITKDRSIRNFRQIQTIW